MHRYTSNGYLLSYLHTQSTTFSENITSPSVRTGHRRLCELTALTLFQPLGLLHVPSLFICVIAPLNAILNYILVWGPGPFAPLRLGFIGAPIASTISVNIMSLFYVVHAYFWAPRAAWFPLNSMRDLNKVLSGEALGFLVRLGAAGVGQTASEWWSWELIGSEYSDFGVWHS